MSASRTSHSRPTLADQVHKMEQIPELMPSQSEPGGPLASVLRSYQKNYEQLVSQGKMAPKSKLMQELSEQMRIVSPEKVLAAKEAILRMVAESNIEFAPELIDEHMDDYRIRHYLVREFTFEKNVALMLKSMEHKQLHLAELVDDRCVPRELYELGVHTTSGLDRNGNPVLYVRMKHIFTNKKLLKIGEHYLSYSLFRMEKLALATSGFWTLMADCTGLVMANYDMDTFLSILLQLYNLHPAVIGKIICYNMHWMIRPLMKICLKMMPSGMQQDIVVVTPSELHQYIDEDQLPPFLGGCREDMKIGVAPEGAISAYDVCESKHGISKEETRILIEDYKKKVAKCK